MSTVSEPKNAATNTMVPMPIISIDVSRWTMPITTNGTSKRVVARVTQPTWVWW
jgi:hypothetical protein